MAVRNKLRFEVFRRDNWQCRYCGRAAKDGAVLEPDHVIPRSRGGRDVATNLVTACEACNSGKSDTPISAPPIEDVPQAAFRRACAERGVDGVELEADEADGVATEILGYFRGAELEDLLQEGRHWLEAVDVENPSPAQVRDQAAVNAYFEARMRIQGLTSVVQRFIELQPPRVVDALYERAYAHRLTMCGDSEPPECLVVVEAANELLQGEDERLLAVLSDEEIVEWLKMADSLYGNTAWGLSDNERVRYAAHAFRVVNGGQRFTALCRARGRCIPQCPEKAEFRIRLDECQGCEPHAALARPEGHVACRRHVEDIRSGEFRCDHTGAAMSLRSVEPLTSDEKEPA